jgi:hypothetical protein
VSVGRQRFSDREPYLRGDACVVIAVRDRVSMESDLDHAMTTNMICNYFDHTATAVDPFWIDHLFLPLGTTV